MEDAKLLTLISDSDRRQRQNLIEKPHKFLLEEDNFLVERRKASSPEIQIRIGDQVTKALLDTGSEVSCISVNFFNHLVKNRIVLEILPVVGINITTATNRQSKRITKQAFLTFWCLEKQFEVVCLVVDDLVKDIILGVDWITKVGMRFYYDKGIMELQGSTISMVSNNELKNTAEVKIQMYTLDEEPEAMREDHEYSNESEIGESELLESIQDNKNLNEEQKKKLLQLLLEFKQIFSKTPGLIDCYEHHIETIQNSFYFNKSYPVPFAFRDAVEKQLSIMLEWNVIERATSLYINPLVVVVKKDKSVRLCLDARTLNQILVPEHESPIVPEELLQQFQNVQYLSTIDMVSSYWQIPLSVSSRKFTAFKYNEKVYQFKVLPFGLSTSVASFTRCMEMVLGPEVKDFAVNYVDDILVTSKTFDNHLLHLRKVFQQLAQAGMTINLNKSALCRDSVPFLGHVLTPSGITPNPKKLELIRDWPAPRNQKQLKGFLGLCSYYRRFSQLYAGVTERLRHLLKKESRWCWNIESEQVFQQIKELFIETVHLSYPDYTRTFFVQCDASNYYGLGGQVFQEDEEGNKLVISMASRLLQSSEINYTTSEKELLAIVWSLEKFRLFITGAKDLIIVTDHKALTFLLQCRLLSGRLARWTLWLQQFSFTIKHCSGKENIAADILSRFPTTTVDNRCDVVGSEEEILVAAIKLLPPVDMKLRKSLKEIEQSQMVDARFGESYRTLMERDEPDEHKQFKLFNKKLFHKAGRGDENWKLCIPSSLIVEVIYAVHVEIGHFGSKKCLAALQEVFYFKNMANS